MSDQVNNIPSEQNATDTHTNPPEKDKSVAIDSAIPKAPVPAVEPAQTTPEKERKQA